jgi:hypothetical protein
MTASHAFWDCTYAIPQAIKEIRLACTGDCFGGKWEERNWRNVPGPIYGALTDTCMAGRPEAPDHVLYDEEGQEFIFRQPSSLPQLRKVVMAACVDPFCGYANDGNEHWTSEYVRSWWRERGKLLDWISQGLRNPLFATHADFVKQKQLEGLQDFEEYVTGALFDYVRSYVFFLDHGRLPTGNECLPDL